MMLTAVSATAATLLNYDKRTCDTVYEAREEHGPENEIDLRHEKDYVSAMEMMNEMNNKMEMIETKQEFEIVIEKMINKFRQMENDKIEFMLLLLLYNQEYLSDTSDTSDTSDNSEASDNETRQEACQLMGNGNEKEEREMSLNENELLNENQDTKTSSLGTDNERNKKEKEKESPNGIITSHRQLSQNTNELTNEKLSDSQNRTDNLLTKKDKKKERESQMKKRDNGNKNEIIKRFKCGDCQDTMAMKSERSRNENENENEKQELKERKKDDGNDGNKNKKINSFNWKQFDRDMTQEDIVQALQLSQIPQYKQDNDGNIVFNQGLLINQRYILLKALESGTYNRVFETLDIVDKRKVALKVHCNATSYKNRARNEITVLEGLKKMSIKNGNDTSWCVRLESEFDWNEHPCLVFKLYGGSVYQLMDQNRHRPLPQYIARDLIMQMCRAMQCIHDLGIVYTGLKPQNLVLVDARTEEIEYGQESWTVPINTRIQIVDFTSVVKETKKYDNGNNFSIQRIYYRAPEVVLEIPWKRAVDIWSMGCIMLELIYGNMVFDTRCSIDHLNQMQKMIGKIPNSWIQQASDKAYEKLFTNDGKLNLENAQISGAQARPLKSYFNMEKAEEQALHDLVQRTLRWEAKERLCAKEMLKHSYFEMNCKSSWDEEGYFQYDIGSLIDYRYKLMHGLGRGAYGSVIKAFDTENERKVAMKIGHKTGNEEEDTKIHGGMRREAWLLEYLNKEGGSEHCISSIIAEKHYYGVPLIIMPLYGPSLWNVLAKVKSLMRLPDNMVKNVFWQICIALEFVDSSELIYGDLKPENIVFVNGQTKTIACGDDDDAVCEIPMNSEIKLIDFGCTISKSNPKKPRLYQSANYRAPEVWLELTWNESIDIWSAGCVVLELMRGDTIFKSNESYHICKNQFLNQVEHLLKCEMPSEMAAQASQAAHMFSLAASANPQYKPKPLKEYFNMESMQGQLLFDLTEKMMKWNPKDRLNIKQVLNHQYFN